MIGEEAEGAVEEKWGEALQRPGGEALLLLKGIGRCHDEFKWVVEFTVVALVRGCNFQRLEVLFVLDLLDNGIVLGHLGLDMGGFDIADCIKALVLWVVGGVVVVLLLLLPLVIIVGH